MLILTFNNAEYRRWIIMCEWTFEMMFVWFFFVLRWLLNIFSLHLPLRHMKEISELQAFQRSEIERLYKELGKTLPPNVSLLHAAPPSGRRRKASKHKLKAGKLLNPMVQQLKNNLNTTSADRKGMWVGNVGWWVAMYPCDVMICVYGRVFAACGEHRNDIRFRKLVGVCDSFWLTLYFFYLFIFSLCQGESAASSSGSPAKSSVLSDGSAHSSGCSSSSNQPSTAPEHVHTQQPCSLKGSFSSDNIYAGLHGDGNPNHAGPGQGTYYRFMGLCVCSLCVVMQMDMHSDIIHIFNNC